ncbi:unnamed protein product [Miscanthus lutarioriparius]|uniref:Uncharacterized protein n=1 Tax=Miscanthus lutarioriparius TaxID=422564 RepID=A0A811Q484_9POAL|nr:unnamed protein product [Miscanthus lutarioriparius]
MAAGAAYGGGAGPFIFWFNGDRFNAGIFSRPATLSSSSIAVGASSLTVGFFQRIPFSIFLSSVKTRRSKATRLNGYDAAAHLTEETFCSIGIISVFGWAYILALIFSIQKADHSTLDDITNNNTVLVQPPVDEAERKREERNRKQREYRARIKANETDEQREERNKRRREQRVLKRTESSTHTIGPDHVTSSNRQRALAKRERYNNMNEHGKENMLQRKRDYKKKMRTQSAEDHLEAPRALDIDDLLDDEETRQYIGEDGAFESNRVSVNGVDLNNNEDPYDYVYQNFPDRHHVLRKVSGAVTTRGVSRQTTRILAKPNKELDPTGKCTKNIVYKDVLQW